VAIIKVAVVVAAAVALAIYVVVVVVVGGGEDGDDGNVVDSWAPAIANFALHTHVDKPATHKYIYIFNFFLYLILFFR